MAHATRLCDDSSFSELEALEFMGSPTSAPGVRCDFLGFLFRFLGLDDLTIWIYGIIWRDFEGLFASTDIIS